MTEPLRFDGRVAIVTGAGGGLGRAHAMLLAALGACVVVNDVGSSERDGTGEMGLGLAASVVAEIAAGGGEAIANTDSVATTEGGAALVAQALDAWGRIDIVVNNAGITGKGALAELEVYERVFATHIFGTVNVLRAAWPHFLEQDYGRVVNTCSSSMFGTPGSGDYASAMGAIFGLSRVLATDNRDHNIRINVLMPIAYTRMTAAMPHQQYVEWFKKWFQPEKVSAFVAYLCHESLECSGEAFTVGGGRAARVVFATTRGYFESDPGPESFRDHFDEVMAGHDQRFSPTGLGDLARYTELLPERGPF
jgi:NAD(P)-dependent dehydrogenase (short-subunit alcohol dehydrogenase family)